MTPHTNDTRNPTQVHAILQGPASSVHATESVEDYLERIHELIESKGYARPIEIAAALNIKQSSVTKMMQRLHDRGYANYEKHRGLTLTAAGVKVALSIRKRHQYVSEFLRMLGIDEKCLQLDTEGIEHHLSPPTMKRLAAFVDYLREHPEVMEDFRNQP
ncbi:MAG: transcriptional regulator MntR [Candidatus Sumerlaeaceae bacterium]|nr:transcriptional regulator MntR [Candidatus Sumerlaeaceae bacterium]